LEDSEDRRSVGGHGNQHVRLRIAQVDHIETFCPALAALCCLEPWQTSGAGFRPVQDFRTSLAKSQSPRASAVSMGLSQVSMLSGVLQNKLWHSIPQI
jgi:hypothetical protein